MHLIATHLPRGNQSASLLSLLSLVAFLGLTTACGNTSTGDGADGEEGSSSTAMNLEGGEGSETPVGTSSGGDSLSGGGSAGGGASTGGSLDAGASAGSGSLDDSDAATGGGGDDTTAGETDSATASAGETGSEGADSTESGASSGDSSSDATTGSDETGGTSDSSSSTSSDDGGSSSGSSDTSDTSAGEDGTILCGSKLYACGNGIDDDGDGKVDLADPDCTTPCDDSENSLQTNLPGGNEPCKSDCFWDSDSGAGNDKCEWNLICDPENPGESKGCDYDPATAMTDKCSVEMPAECIDVCSTITPNGCDCFGCCEVTPPAGGNSVFIYLDSNSACSMDNLEACYTCTFHPGCNNTCNNDECELCFGQSEDDLPEHCTDGTSCDEGVMSCSTASDCAAGMFCQTGCCRDIVID